MSEPIDELKENEPKREKVRIIPIELIDDFPEHPFQVKDGGAYTAMKYAKKLEKKVINLAKIEEDQEDLLTTHI